MNSPKYNRTFHLPWSNGATSDDKRAPSVDTLLNQPLIITEKMDGSNTSLEDAGCFSRTHSGPPTHLSFDGLKALHSAVRYKIPQGIQLFGEWCYARHSIEYSELPDYFLLFNVRDLNYQEGIWLSWEEVQEWAQLLDVPTVPVLFQGIISSEKELRNKIKSFMIEPSLCGGIKEGVVVRVAESFTDNDFSTHVMKFVRANHIDPANDHWIHQQIVRNKLKI